MLWVGVDSSQVSSGIPDWCEVGWTKGWTDASGNKQSGYAHFYARYLNGAYSEAFPGTPVGAAGTSHHYQIFRQYDGKYNVYIDNQDIGDCFANPFTLWAQVGLEYTSPTAKAEANDPRQLQWRRSSDLVWFNWGSLGTPVRSHQDGSSARWRWVTFPIYGRDWTIN